MRLSEPELKKQLGDFPWDILLLEETLSTNAFLKAHSQLPHGSVVIANRQSGGRGRLGRQFASPEGGLYLSLLLRPPAPVEGLLHLTAMAAVAVRRGIADHCGLAPDIKWINDLLWQSKKLCGILAEAVYPDEKPRLILGIGINCNTAREAFPEELRDTACSLCQILGRETDPNALAACILRRLYEMEQGLFSQKADWLEEYASACVTLGKQVRVLDPAGAYEGEAVGIDKNGGLLVKKSDGATARISAGEVSVRGLYGYS